MLKSVFRKFRKNRKDSTFGSRSWDRIDSAALRVDAGPQVLEVLLMVLLLIQGNKRKELKSLCVQLLTKYQLDDGAGAGPAVDGTAEASGSMKAPVRMAPQAPPAPDNVGPKGRWWSSMRKSVCVLFSFVLLVVAVQLWGVRGEVSRNCQDVETLGQELIQLKGLLSKLQSCRAPAPFVFVTTPEGNDKRIIYRASSDLTTRNVDKAIEPLTVALALVVESTADDPTWGRHLLQRPTQLQQLSVERSEGNMVDVPVAKTRRSIALLHAFITAKYRMNAIVNGAERRNRVF